MLFLCMSTYTFSCISEAEAYVGPQLISFWGYCGLAYLQFRAKLPSSS